MIVATAALSSALLAHDTALGLFFREVVDDRPEAPGQGGGGAGGVYRAGSGVGGGSRAASSREGAPSLNSWTPRLPQQQQLYPVSAAKHE